MAACPFKRELEVFGGEVDDAARFLFGELSVGTLTKDHPDVVKRLDIAPQFWTTVLHALETSALFAFGRIFESEAGSKHNAARLMREAARIEIFSKQALRQRKSELNSDGWLEEFIAAAYEPTEGDIVAMRQKLDEWRKVYNEKYRPVRNKSLAHREFANHTDELHALLSNTKLGELKHMCFFLISLHDALWQLYHNGKKPALVPAEHSIQHLLSSDHRRSNTLPEIIAGQVREFFEADLSQ